MLARAPARAHLCRARRLKVADPEPDLFHVSRPRTVSLARLRMAGDVAVLVVDHTVPDRWAHAWTQALFANVTTSRCAVRDRTWALSARRYGTDVGPRGHATKTRKAPLGRVILLADLDPLELRKVGDGDDLLPPLVRTLATTAAALASESSVPVRCASCVATTRPRPGTLSRTPLCSPPPRAPQNPQVSYVGGLPPPASVTGAVAAVLTFVRDCGLSGRQEGGQRALTRPGRLRWT